MQLGNPSRIAVLAIPLLIPILPLRAQTSGQTAAVDDDSAVAAIVNRSANRFLEGNPQSVGLSIGIIKGGRTYTYNYGTSERGRRRLPTAGTLYPIASITKTFTGIMLAQAALEKRLGLADDVRKYLDGDYPNLAFEGHPVRLYDLLDHRSGLPFFLPDVPESVPDYQHDAVPLLTRLDGLHRNYSRRDFFADLHTVKLEAIPGGEAAHYSNAAAQLAGYILERVYGLSYAALLREKILGPLGMHRSCIAPRCHEEKDVAKGYDEKGNEMPDNAGVLEAAGALKSTVSDLLKYLQWQLAEEDPAVTRSHEPVVTSGDYAAGLNWQLWRAHGERLVWQSGSIDGFHALCAGLMGAKIGLVLLANEADSASSKGQEAMANAILKDLDPQAIPLP